MATLTKVKSEPRINLALASSIPAPFPREALAASRSSVDISFSQPQPQPQLQQSEAGPSTVSDTTESRENDSLHELMPSILHVERACIMALNNLLSLPVHWKTIVPDRRHSMPNTSKSSSSPVEESSSALHTLVSNLRSSSRGTEEMIEASPSENDADLIQELGIRVNEISSSLNFSDAELIETLTSLLSHLNRLSVLINPSSRQIPTASPWSIDVPTESDNLFDTLKRQLSDFQVERLANQQDVMRRGSKPVFVVEASLLWSRIDQELDRVVMMCKERTDYLSLDPPDYEYDTLPGYDHESRYSIEDFAEKDQKRTHAAPPSIMAGGQMSEKRKLDLEAVTMAIDRLYLVVPQLHNQRVELKSTKLAQMEKARTEGSQMTHSSRADGKQKERERDVKELENMLRLIDKASGRTLKDQSVILDGGMKTKLEKIRQRDMREIFVDQLAEHSSARRLHDQDASLEKKPKDPKAMLSLPEFIREAIPSDSLNVHHPQALLTLPEFIKEVPPPPIMASRSPGSSSIKTSISGGALARLRSKTKNRDRSMSAPPLAWLRSSSSKSSLRESQTDGDHSQLSFEINYVAELHENLQHILVFFTVTGAQPSVDLEAEAFPSFSDFRATDGDYLIIKSGSKSSLPIALPAHVSPGKWKIQVQSDHFEIKLATLLASSSSAETKPLLDAAQLSAENATSFICSSCSLPVIQSSQICYRDLPSEHWEELVDAWMCHSSQTLNENIIQNGRSGFWPESDQALVGGSYIIFENAAMAKDNLLPELPKVSLTPLFLWTIKKTDVGEPHQRSRTFGCHPCLRVQKESCHLVRCLCGSVLGRRQERPSSQASAFKIFKYAIRPVSPSSEPFRIPLSAFIVEDMIEFVQAHASYRFVISDDEDERPRILVWLFKPKLQLAYTVSKGYSIPKSGSIHAAKVLFKLIGPSDSIVGVKTILDKYPGFPQAEYLFYPMDTCRRLAVLLKESNRTYPENMRTMTGLEVGWLQRS
ncbi:hypothetical protein D9757_004143 [Collybiopsis confluens]|uniref:Uncharacterized protein n=1 Tax=Collybiopsis confluens TaxID=2823264 RepID=A0A8H5HUM7_9AGAR|nr:hypothetical protein D9757_004143 [Collybiopsis confluens]